MADRWAEEGRELEVLKARPVKLGAERLHQREWLGGYNLKAPQDYHLDKNHTMQFRLVRNVLYVCACVLIYIYICIMIYAYICIVERECPRLH